MSSVWQSILLFWRNQFAGQRALDKKVMALIETPDLWIGTRVANSAGDEGMTQFELAVFLRSKVGAIRESLQRLEADGHVKRLRDGSFHPTTRWVSVRAAQRQALLKTG